MDIRIIIVAMLATLACTAAAVDQTGKAYNTLYAGLGIKGHDPVSYFSDGKPAAGSERFTHEWGGVTWRFVSAGHRDAFAKEPARYAPAYGGFCSWGIAQGKLFDVDPVNAWKIVDGRLYLNFNADIQKVWEGDATGFIAKAGSNWPKLDR